MSGGGGGGGGHELMIRGGDYRLLQHCTNKRTDKCKFYWNVVCIINRVVNQERANRRKVLPSKWSHVHTEPRPHSHFVQN